MLGLRRSCASLFRSLKVWLLIIHIPFQVLSKCRGGNIWKEADLRGKENPVSPHSLLTWNGWTTENTEKHHHDRPGCRNHLIEYNSQSSQPWNLPPCKCSHLEFLQNTWEKTFTHLELYWLRKSESWERIERTIQVFPMALNRYGLKWLKTFYAYMYI